MLRREFMAAGTGTVLLRQSAVAGASYHNVPNDFFGIHINCAGDAPLYKLPSTPFPAQLSPRAIRFWDNGVTWKLLNPEPNVFDWARMDNLVSLAKTNHCKVTYVLGQPPNWAAINPTDNVAYNANPPRNISDWTNYVSAVAERYGNSIDIWELWNEPDVGSFSGSLGEMVELCKAAYYTLKMRLPQSFVLSPSFTHNQYHRTVNLINFMGAGGLKFSDGVAVHLYPPDGTRPEISFDQVREMRSLLDGGGYKLDMFDTESGHRGWRDSKNNLHDYPAHGFGEPLPVTPFDLQSAYVTRHFLSILSTGNISQSYYYTFDNPDGTRGTTSVMSIHMTHYPDQPAALLRPAYAYKFIATLLPGGKIGSLNVSYGISEVEFQTKNGLAGKAVWCDDYKVGVTSTTGYTTITDNIGIKIAAQGTSTRVDGSPRFLFR